MNIAIVGATGNVGRKILEVLEKKELAIDNLYLLASSRSAGSKINFNGNLYIGNKKMSNEIENSKLVIIPKVKHSFLIEETIGELFGDFF